MRLVLTIVVSLTSVFAVGCDNPSCVRHSDCISGFQCAAAGVCEPAPTDAGASDGATADAAADAASDAGADAAPIDAAGDASTTPDASTVDAAAADSGP